MKKFITSLTAIILAITVLVSCKSGASGDAYDIRMHLAKGDTFTQQHKMTMNMVTTAMGQTMDMKMTMDGASKFEVMNDDSLNRELKMTYTRMDMGMDMGALVPKGMGDSLMKNSTSEMVGKSIVLKLNDKNEITDVAGMDEIMMNDSMDQKTKDLMKQMFSKDQMNNMFGLMFGMYPNKPVKIGESWNSKTTASVAGMDMKVNIKYTLVGVKNGLADIDVDGNLDGKGKMKQETMSMDMNMSGTQKGTLTIKTDNGRLTSGNYKMDVKAEMEMMGQKIPMTMKMNYDLKGE